MIGHPGSGTTFLFSTSAICKVPTVRITSNTVSIPCRSKEWHLLEEERHEKKQVINSSFIIGLEANQGIFERELTSDKNISITVDDKDSKRLGLMQVHMKVARFGVRVKVWTFQHLTIQEYMAAVSICNNSWTNQCLISVT